MFQRPSTPDINTDVVVIGAGPSGITAAKLLQQHGLTTWLLGSHFESQIAKAGPLKNVEKIPENTIGLDHIEVMINEMKEVGGKHKTSLCTKIEANLTDSDKIVVHTKHQKFIAKYVIITTGAKQGKLKFKGEEEFLHRGISDCAVCDWGLFRGKIVGVIGNHEYTLRATEFLKEHVEKLYLLWYLEQTNHNDPDIEVFSNVHSLEVYGTEVLEGIKFDHEGGSENLQISGLFVEGMPVPSTDFLNQSGININDSGYILINENYTTNLKNIWAAGDVTGKTKSYDGAVEDGENVANELIKLINK